MQVPLCRYDEYPIGLDKQSFRDQFDRHRGEAWEDNTGSGLRVSDIKPPALSLTTDWLPARKKEPPMPQGDKSSYTDKQKRQAEHIEASYEKKGLNTKTAEARAWATVNKLTGGGKKSGSGRRKG